MSLKSFDACWSWSRIRYHCFHYLHWKQAGRLLVRHCSSFHCLMRQSVVCEALEQHHQRWIAWRIVVTYLFVVGTFQLLFCWHQSWTWPATREERRKQPSEISIDKQQQHCQLTFPLEEVDAFGRVICRVDMCCMCLEREKRGNARSALGALRTRQFEIWICASCWCWQVTHNISQHSILPFTSTFSLCICIIRYKEDHC